MSVRDAIAAALVLADEHKRADLLRAEGLLALLPEFAERLASEVLGEGAVR